jgi:uncharacterized protein (DUF1800 family)
MFGGKTKSELGYSSPFELFYGKQELKNGVAMNTLNRPRSIKTLARRPAALVSLLALVSGLFTGMVGAQQQRAQAQRLTEDQRILHVLNRLGFGARPGDVERVRASGLEKYIGQQLYPEKIDDALAEARLQNLPSLRMTTAEIYAKYPSPNILLRVLEARGQLPPELALLRERREKGGNQAGQNVAGAPMPNEDGAMMNAPEGAAAKGNEKEADAARPANDNEYRRAMRDYYLKNNLRLPQQLMVELQSSRILRAVYSERQLQEVMVDFWTNHFNVFAGKGADRWLLTSYDRDTIRPNTFGKFRDLLQATAESPAMLFYLDNFQSVSPNAQMGNGRRQGALPGELMRRRANRDRARDANPNASDQQGKMPNQQAQQRRQRRGINENYARELMELHTLGVDGGYTQKDVQEVARCFTGWTINNPRGGGRGDTENAGRFYFNPRLHDNGEKVVLGHKIPAGGGVNDGLMVLDILARHPSTAKFIATKLARRFVMDEPSLALVQRISAAFTKSDGDIRETLKAIIASPEFNSHASYRAKIKTPFELAVSAIRTLGGETNGGPAIHQWIARMGEPLYMYQAPTGYPDQAEDWVNTGALLERLNFALALASNRIPGTRVDLARFAGETTRAASVDKTRLMERFFEVILDGDVSVQTKATLMKQLNEPLPATQEVASAGETGRTNEPMRAGGGRRGGRQFARADTGVVVGNPEVVKIAGLILGSPEFQRQ